LKSADPKSNRRNPKKKPVIGILFGAGEFSMGLLAVAQPSSKGAIKQIHTRQHVTTDSASVFVDV
jgi:hypothetical protein